MRTLRALALTAFAGIVVGLLVRIDQDITALASVPSAYTHQVVNFYPPKP